MILVIPFSCQILAQTQSDSVSPSNAQRPALILSDTESRYDLVGMEETSQFLKPPSGVSIEGYFQYSTDKDVLASATNRPNFNGGNRYWFSVDIYNETEQEDWQLHVSNFFIKNVEVLIDENSNKKLYQSNFSQGIGQVETNPIGRSFALKLARGKKTTLVLQLSADNHVWGPYIGIMARPYYNHWSNVMDYIYRTAIGIILGLILCAVIGFFLLEDGTYLWFSVSSSLLLVFYLLRGSMNIELLNRPYELSQSLWILVSFTAISLLLFAYSFLKINKKSPIFYYAYILNIGFSALILCLSFVLSSEASIKLYSANAVALVTVIFFSGIAKVFRGEKYYLLFMLGWLPVLLSLTEYINFIFVEDQSNELLGPSYKVIREMFIQISHMLIHLIAMTVRIKELRKEKLTAELENKAKSQFLASASHDLRQPLHAMGMFISSLKPHINSPTGLKLLRSLELSQGSMNKTFLSLMDISKLDAGAVRPDRQAFALKPLLTQLQLEYTEQAAAKNLVLKVVGTSLWVDSDPLLLERIIRNLLVNAIHYTSQGKILVGCRRKGNSVSIEVWDCGHGISEDALSKIFDEYERGYNTKDSPEGMGLGLSIVRRTADLLNHKLSVRSTLGRGTVFSLELPRIIPSKTSMSVQSANSVDSPLEELNVALIDDDPEICQAMSSLLTQWGCDVLTASSLRKFTAAIESNHFQPDLLISDLNLSDQVNGLEVFAQIEEILPGNIVTALITADTTSELLKLAHERGILVLFKPVNPAQLRSLLSYVKSRRFANA
ncbi:MAG: ATP-binding protein [Gammaproteobacteria bacterium]